MIIIATEIIAPVVVITQVISVTTFKVLIIIVICHQISSSLIVISVKLFQTFAHY